MSVEKTPMSIITGRYSTCCHCNKKLVEGVKRVFSWSIGMLHQSPMVSLQPYYVNEVALTIALGSNRHSENCDAGSSGSYARELFALSV